MLVGIMCTLKHAHVCIMYMPFYSQSMTTLYSTMYIFLDVRNSSTQKLLDRKKSTDKKENIWHYDSGNLSGVIQETLPKSIKPPYL